MGLTGKIYWAPTTLYPNGLNTRSGPCETPDRETLLNTTVGPTSDPLSPALLRPCSGCLVPGLLGEGGRLALLWPHHSPGRSQAELPDPAVAAFVPLGPIWL